MSIPLIASTTSELLLSQYQDIFSKYLKSSICSGYLNLEQSNTYPSQWVIHLYIRPHLISVVSKEPFDVSLITIVGPFSVRVSKLHPLL